MKHGLIALLVLFFSLNLQARLSGTYQLGMQYQSNIFELSNSDLDTYEDGDASFSYIESADDVALINSLSLDYGFRYHKIRFTPNIKISADRMLSNPDKSNYAWLAGMDWKYRSWFGSVEYANNLQNYTRKYTDTDGTGNQEKFEYDKDQIKVTVNYDILSYLRLSANYKLEDYYYNKYFTEDDGTASTITVGSRYEWDTFYLTGSFGYRVFDADKSKVPGTDKPLLSDVSYESNLYKLQLETKHLRFAGWKPVKFELGFNMENRCYTSDYSIDTDPIHSSRVDHMLGISGGVTYYWNTQIDFALDVSQELRNVNSDNGNLADVKDYHNTGISLTAQYHW